MTSPKRSVEFYSLNPALKHEGVSTIPDGNVHLLAKTVEIPDGATTISIPAWAAAVHFNGLGPLADHILYLLYERVSVSDSAIRILNVMVDGEWRRQDVYEPNPNSGWTAAYVQRSTDLKISLPETMPLAEPAHPKSASSQVGAGQHLPKPASARVFDLV